MEQGRQLTHYTLVEKIGQGGMGEVWRASDTRLDRDVAIKILPPAFVADEERLTRFEREAKALAALNHPNVAQIFGIDQVDDVCFLVLELVPGESLAERLERGSLPLDEALPIARQVAEGLEAAHDAHVIHRDLKPANVRVTPEGVVKVLDFGLAKADRADPETGEALPFDSDSLELTVEGRVLGTPTYMSPEQARGRPTDRRTDIWAFGCVLFELLSGRRPFGGETVTDVLGAIIHKEPEWDALPEHTPQRVHDLLRRCLVKDPRQRLRDAGDARLELQEILASPSALLGGGPGSPHGSATSGARPPLVVVAMMLGLLLGGAAAWFAKQVPEVRAPLRVLRLAEPDLQAEPSLFPVLSPQGHAYAFQRGGELWWREFGALEARRLPDTSGARHAFWSPDGTELGFEQDGWLWRVALRGGRRRICRSPEAIDGNGDVIWLEDDTILWSTTTTGGPVYSVPATGGEPSAVLNVDPNVYSDVHQLAPLPGGRGVLMVLHDFGELGARSLAAWSRGDEPPEVLLTLDGESSASIGSLAYDPSGFVVYTVDGDPVELWAFRFSASERRREGPPFLLMSEAGEPSIGSDGSLLATSRAAGVAQWLSWVDRTGEVLGDVAGPISGDVRAPLLSPDGTRASLVTREAGEDAVWIYELATGARRRLAPVGDAVDMPVAWTPGGDQLLVMRLEEGGALSLLLLATDGSGRERHVMNEAAAFALTPDGSAAFVTRIPFNSEFLLVPLSGDDEPRRILPGLDSTERPELSPDGELVVIGSQRAGRGELFLTRIPQGEERWLLAEDDGSRPTWSPSGDEVFYQSGKTLRSVSVTRQGEGLELGEPQTLFDAEPLGIRLDARYAVSADSERLLVVRTPAGEHDDAEMMFVENLAELLESR